MVGVPHTVEPDSLDSLLESPQLAIDPYPIYAALRTHSPVHWWKSWGGWTLTTYEDVAAILRREGRGSSVVGRVARAVASVSGADTIDVRVLTDHFSTGISHTDPPEHTRIRAVLNKAFSVRDIDRLRPRITRVAHTLLQAVDPARPWDVIADFAYPLPAIVISEVIGIPPEDRDQVKAWSDDITVFFGSNHLTPEIVHAGSDAVSRAREYLHELAARRIAEPSDDVLSRLGQAAKLGEGISDDELLSTMVTFMVGGHETTTALISSGLLSLVRNPDQLELLQSNPELLVGAVEEFMRYESPNQRLVRIATSEMDLHGKRIRPGDRLMLLLGAANRDPDQFVDPDRLDVTRTPNRHLGFALGAHFCLGANLARLEAEIAIRAVLEYVPSLVLEGAEPTWLPNPTFRMLEELRVTG